MKGAFVFLPDLKGGMARDGYLIKAPGPVEFEAFLRAKLEQIGNIVREAKIKNMASPGTASPSRRSPNYRRPDPRGGYLRPPGGGGVTY